MIVVIRMSGQVGLKEDINNTLNRLNLRRKLITTLVRDTKENQGMLKKVRYNICFGTINKETLFNLISKRGKIVGGKNLTKEQAEKVIVGLEKGKSLRELGLKPFFRLSPPIKGFKNTKQAYPHGDLGKHAKINELLERMI